MLLEAEFNTNPASSWSTCWTLPVWWDDGCSGERSCDGSTHALYRNKRSRVAVMTEVTGDWQVLRLTSSLAKCALYAIGLHTARRYAEDSTGHKHLFVSWRQKCVCAIKKYCSAADGEPKRHKLQSMTFIHVQVTLILLQVSDSLHLHPHGCVKIGKGVDNLNIVVEYRYLRWGFRAYTVVESL